MKVLHHLCHILLSEFHLTGVSSVINLLRECSLFLLVNSEYLIIIYKSLYAMHNIKKLGYSVCNASLSLMQDIKQYLPYISRSLVYIR